MIDLDEFDFIECYEFMQKRIDLINTLKPLSNIEHKIEHMLELEKYLNIVHGTCCRITEQEDDDDAEIGQLFFKDEAKTICEIMMNFDLKKERHIKRIKSGEKCPDCGNHSVHGQPRGGVACEVESCAYWFCY